MESATATDVCDGMFKSKNITVHGNATIVKQTGPKFVYNVEQRKVLELINCGRKVPDSRTRWTGYSKVIRHKNLKGEKASHCSLN